ncbi:protein-export membrane protein SecD [Caldicellulosiruptor saccharolyticus DSM 8903]|uniref:Protein translocase subunit SecD n=1 Tax=Caldicellulosiruptor saccharolyticus (strain ATCC 43494 / DSM 8903 / Tp8T 6331) TaxID=351627 RepID=A4XIR1_CALS8|nr:protein translocase subunit SecD [Caldicellulosiruptor saccharolyticus]ABP66796.1 protein-export membrane protein SecD [Caldicellulosiruptor saccharolyticus DSM 8903]
MQNRSLAQFLIASLIIAFAFYIVFFGLNIGTASIPSVKDVIRYGLDLKGGVYIVYEAAKENPTKREMESAVQLIRTRLDMRNFYDATATLQGSKRIRVEIPGVKDPDEAIQYIGRTALIEFKGPQGDLIVSGRDVVDAYAQQTAAGYVVALKFNKEGTKKFAEGTRKYLGQNIGIYLDGKLISNPTVEEEITNGEAIIRGMKDLEEAKTLAQQIKAGALPFALNVVESRAIGPSLGNEALRTTLKAGIIGLLLVFLFMIIFYRLPGFIADIALVAYVVILVAIVGYAKITLTLPGIAGIILSAGMAVDANILIFARMKEELRAGKTLKAAMDAGFRRALNAVIDSNITTIIAGLVLLFLGTGPIKGFAWTLTIGIVVSFFTAITVTRFLLVSIINTGFFKDMRWYGGKKTREVRA